MARATSATIAINMLNGVATKEILAGGVIRPGDRLAIAATATAALAATEGLAFAMEDVGQGKGVGDNYASGDRVFYLSARQGDVIYCRAAGAIAAGALVYGDAAGAVGTTATNPTIGVAKTAAAGAGDLIEVEIMGGGH